MPDRRKHRGAHPGDASAFAPSELGKLRGATEEYAWLLERGYASAAALKLVGDHHQLVARQRVAVSRMACSESERRGRAERRLEYAALAGRRLRVDGFNCCIGVEVALSGGVVLVGLDGACRDLASVHGTYRRVSETPRALELIVAALEGARAEHVCCYFDRPVSNSAALSALLRAIIAGRGLAIEAELSDTVDRDVSAPGGVALSADSAVINRAPFWFDLVGHIIREHIPGAWLVDARRGAALPLGSPSAEPPLGDDVK